MPLWSRACSTPRLAPKKPPNTSSVLSAGTTASYCSRQLRSWFSQIKSTLSFKSLLDLAPESHPSNQTTLKEQKIRSLPSNRFWACPIRKLRMVFMKTCKPKLPNRKKQKLPCGQRSIGQKRITQNSPRHMRIYRAPLPIEKGKKSCCGSLLRKRNPDLPMPKESARRLRRKSILFEKARKRCRMPLPTHLTSMIPLRLGSPSFKANPLLCAMLSLQQKKT